ncbi:2-oxoglutarate dehydrogenase E1 component [Neptunomonas phycophila]|jgi:2-oxoglutarate dehydrogenase E1 component|uniref:2-oxoglutarate dehydrogenase E1 component n=2 Tax=Neptunomonas phycophila TaxID=1572645 RepID=A0AAW7XIX7_9GAMM|nr:MULTISPECIES: 2-oxoglutarate dehydrogenase E1 component [Neptunomonas]MBT3147403.1 2-oxoglutarate dehydrogenase E1 component [Neptunomonas phycophila]MDN2660423.1 2-oxoglutarate dehydrogenase E1 component [Neptunomonas sp. CHC150]MDO6453995.1 2-oxoglutarate dehydrogenase E1 component [Neptunomonas phycophila]MDO6785184.1 2-oxoglutarate dehydrogenase E1 component [Neptunomonas phycophila]MDP2523790.1 2-oxoglutarate dehydrogenase E1 component [Neptunomonas phycophila]
MQEGVMELLWKNAHLYGGNLSYVEQLYETYLMDPNAVSQEWRDEFDKLPKTGESISQDVPHSPVREHFLYLSKNQSRSHPVEVASVSSDHEKKQVRVLRMINAYRVRGHQMAEIDPLHQLQREDVPDLALRFHELSESDYDTTFQLGSLFFGTEEAPLKSIVEDLKKTYCSTVGAEYMHIVDTQEKRWLQSRIEPVRAHPEVEVEKKKMILERLTAAEGLEKYLGSRYAGAKRFGLEGGESLIVSLNTLIQRAGKQGAKEIVIGMAHRGRLNTLVNIFGKNPAELFSEFEGKKTLDTSGDVKYHQGFSSNVMTEGGEVHIAMAFNPSHLEIVAPVVEGSVRARQDRRDDTVGTSVVPVSIHGDAAFAGQGVVMETFQMSQTRAYKTGGTIHIVVNNQVGFTTSKREDARSTEYCTDVAKIVQAPIFHVNGDDPEAVRFVTQVAVDYRNEFHKDVVIDLVCYRRRGHNEADEPSGTQPLMYAEIKKHKSVRELYSDAMIAQGVVTAEESKELERNYRQSLENGEHVALSLVKEPNTELFVDWKPYLGHSWSFDCDTTVDIKLLQELGNKICQTPQGFTVQRQVQKIIDDRLKMAAGAMELNWGMAESLAYATMLAQGHPVRLTGQDVGRGTFSHRHAVLHDQKTAETYVPLANLSEGQPRLTLYDSLLSEEAVLGFEYGYATTMPNSMVIWEAQFGDFANGAQVVIDQFITSGEHKWQRLCGLTMLLPHGFEGQGPEHSSARLERFLQMSAEHNIQVCTPTTPAQIYHLLRRQIIRPLRKPLIVMSPKSLLRHKQAVSTLEDLAEGSFQPVIPETDNLDPKKVKRVVLCGGKVYYDLYNRRAELEKDDVAIVRIEQLYPFPEDILAETIKDYTNLESVVWCQEEPMNQGAWYCTQHHMRASLKMHNPALQLEGVGRPAAAAPAVGYISVHVEQQEKLVNDAING